MKVKEKMIEGVAMTQNLTYTRCGDSVSYTHLDVYKRQPLWPAHCRAGSDTG